MAYTAIDKATDHFKTVLYTGQHPSATTVSVGFKSDFLWIKSRTQTYNHYAFDTTRGGNSQLNPNLTAKASTSGDNVTFNATSFDANTQALNEGAQGSNNMVSFSWKANGGTTASNSSGSITSTVQANTTAGISIVKYDGTGSNATVGHGLGVAPAAIIIKNYTRSSLQSWIVAHARHPSGFNDASFLDLQNAKDTDSGYWNNTSPTSTVFSVGNNNKCNGNGDNHIAYCFANKQGFSSFSSYIGNGSTDGQFVYTGFKPAWVMIKNVEQSKDWYIFHNKVPGFNPNDRLLAANSNAAEVDDHSEHIDLLSNGFKLRENFSHTNSDGFRYIYFAFADSPFTSSAGVPTTAF